MNELQKMQSRMGQIVEEAVEIVNEMTRVVAIEIDDPFPRKFNDRELQSYLQYHRGTFINYFFGMDAEDAFDSENECTRSAVTWAEAQIIPLCAEYRELYEKHRELYEKHRILFNDESAARRMAEEIANREFAASLVEESLSTGRQIILEDTSYGDGHYSWKMVRVEAAPSPGRVDDQGDAVVEMVSEDIGILSSGCESMLVLHDLEGTLTPIMDMREFMGRRSILQGLLYARGAFNAGTGRTKVREAILAKLAESEDGMRSEDVASALPAFNENLVQSTIWDLEKAGKIEFVNGSCNFRVVKK
jgi:hypothetical protein